MAFFQDVTNSDTRVLMGTTWSLSRVYDVNTLSWIAMTQPVVKTDTLNVALTGVATAANQATEITSLSSIDGKLASSTALQASTAAGLIVRQVPQPGVSGDVTFHANRLTGSLATDGRSSFGGQVDAGTFAGTITPKMSFDGGATYVAGQIVRHDTGSQSFALVLTNPNAAVPFTLYTPAALSPLRMGVTRY